MNDVSKLSSQTVPLAPSPTQKAVGIQRGDVKEPCKLWAPGVGGSAVKRGRRKGRGERMIWISRHRWEDRLLEGVRFEPQICCGSGAPRREISGCGPPPICPTPSLASRGGGPFKSGQGAPWWRNADSAARGRSWSWSRSPEPGAEPERSRGGAGPIGPSQQPSWGRGRAVCTGPGRRGRGRSPAARGALGSSVPGSSGICFKMSLSWTGSCGSAGR